MISRTIGSVLFAFTASASVAQAATLRVPQQYPTIQAAVTAAVEGDIVRVAAGTYAENVKIEGKAISLIGAGATTTTIDGQAQGRVVEIVNAGNGTVTVSGFTLRNGDAVADNSFAGGGLSSMSSHTIARDNVITHNTACNGTGLSAWDGSIKAIRNRIVANYAAHDCSTNAVFLVGLTDSYVEQNVIADHQTSAVIIQSAATIYFRRNIVRNNVEDPVQAWHGWGGLGSYSAALVLEDNLFTNNSGSIVGAVFLAHPNIGTHVIRNNSFSANTGAESSALAVGSSTANPINNRFDDAQDIPEISCNGTVVQISAKNNVFARDTNLFAYPCDVQP